MNTLKARAVLFFFFSFFSYLKKFYQEGNRNPETEKENQGRGKQKLKKNESTKEARDKRGRMITDEYHREMIFSEG